MSDYEELASPEDFLLTAFAEENMSLFSEYVDLRIQGRTNTYAFRAVFGYAYVQDGLHVNRIYALEQNPVYRRLFRERLASVKSNELWNPKIAINEMLQIVRDPNLKEAARLAAIKELNVLFNITITDPAGNTRQGRRLQDFYADEAAAEGKTAPPTDTLPDDAHTTH